MMMTVKVWVCLLFHIPRTPSKVRNYSVGLADECDRDRARRRETAGVV